MGCTHQGVGPEAVSQHHPLAEGLVLVILLRKLCWPVNAKASTIHCSCAPVGTRGGGNAECEQKSRLMSAGEQMSSLSWDRKA